MDCGWIGLDFVSPTDASVDAGRDGATLDGAPLECDGGTGCMVPECPDSDAQAQAGVCGCGVDDATDSDSDSIPDCVDFCLGEPDRVGVARCGCDAASADADGDGISNCMDLCPYDADKSTAGICGCGVSDADGDEDGTPDCVDACGSDPAKSQPGECGCGVSESDTDVDGRPDCIDACSGVEDSDYVADDSCGDGYCRAFNVPSSCLAGQETSCQPASPLSADDSTCDGVDDDCDGVSDDDFVDMSSSCGLGACLSSGTVSCRDGQLVDACVPAARLAADDVTCDGVDDDCDGATDEDAPVTPTTCDMGSCASSGTLACVDGQFVDSCDSIGASMPSDPTCNNIDEDCDGSIDEDFASMMSNCGVGECASIGTITCMNGATSNSCSPGTPPSLNDVTCDGRDQDCDGRSDEEYMVTPTSCGTGVCARSGLATCSGGSIDDSCVPGPPNASTDDSFVPGNGLDDDCDGAIDEDVPPCDTTPRTFVAGAHNVTVPGGCSRVSVRLWGGAGASGQQVLAATGGDGGPGGYAAASLLVTTPIQLYVGTGAAASCNAGGTNAGSSSYNGGTGGSGTGANGADGSVMGGSGGVPSQGDRGGNGSFGGGGGGQGRGGLGTSGNGGGGGAATVILMNGMRAALAGGGGGGGGSQAVTIIGTIASRGGAGGSGCNGNGRVDAGIGGGGGGGGTCQGAQTQASSDRLPAFSADIPTGTARGGAGNCAAGGDGYAILTFAP